MSEKNTFRVLAVRIRLSLSLRFSFSSSSCFLSLSIQISILVILLSEQPRDACAYPPFQRKNVPVSAEAAKTTAKSVCMAKKRVEMHVVHLPLKTSRESEV